MLINIDHLNFSYSKPFSEVGSRLVLSDICLEIAAGERLCLLGHNGSGKTTLAKHLNGLLKPVQGTVHIDGKNTQNFPVHELAKDVAMSFQNPDTQICRTTVWDEVAFGPQNLGFEKDKINNLVQEALALFELEGYTNTNPHDLDYSERKCIAHASAFAMDGKILVFDEPTAGLDAKEITLYNRGIDHLTGKGKTILVISHDMDFIAENISRAICLENGNKMFDGSIKELFAHQDLVESCGLLLPQIARVSTFYGFKNIALTPTELFDQLLKKTK